MISDADIAKLLKGREIIDTYRAQVSQDADVTTKLIANIKGLDPNFAGIQDFYTFNEQMCIQALKDLPVYGTCDLCAGWKSKTNIPYCQQAFGAGSCAAKGIALTINTMYKAILQRLQLGHFGKYDWPTTISNFKAFADVQGRAWFCPQGHGFYVMPSTANIAKFVLWWQ